MGMYLPPMGAMFGGWLAWGISAIFTDSLFVVGLAVVFGLVIGYLAWLYSPLPTGNGGFGLPPAKRQKWGWTSEPAKKYSDPTTEEVVSPAVPFGFKFAKPGSEEGGDDE